MHIYIKVSVQVKKLKNWGLVLSRDLDIFTWKRGKLFHKFSAETTNAYLPCCLNTNLVKSEEKLNVLLYTCTSPTGLELQSRQVEYTETISFIILK